MRDGMQVIITRKILYRQLLILCCLLCPFYASSQCPAPAVFIDRITAIEQNNDTGNETKIQQLDSLLKLCRQCLPIKDSVYARIVHRLGNLYRLQGDWVKAIRYTREAIDVNSHSKGAQPSFLANSYFNLGLFYNTLYLYPESLHYFDSCILIGVKYPEKTAIAMMAFERKAFSLYGTGDYQKSIETADMGIALAARRQDTLSEVALLAQKAQSQVALNDTVAATQNIRSALQILPANAPPEHQATCFTIYAGILGKEKKFKAAIAFYQQAFQVNQRLQRWDQCALNMLDMGYLCNDEMKDAVGAIRYYQQGIQLAVKSGDPYVLAGVYNNLGSAYWRLHQYPKALRYYQKGLNALPVHFTDTALQSNPDDQMLKEIANDYYVSTLLANKGESLLAMYHTSKDSMWLHNALRAFLAADKAVDLMRWKQYGDPSRLFWRNQTRKMYEQAIETCYLLRNTTAAFHFFEKSRAVLLNDKLNELGARKYLSTADISNEQTLRIHIISLQQQLDLIKPNTPAYQQTYTQLLSARDALERAIKDLEKKYPAYYQYKYDTVVYTVSDIRKYLSAHGKSLAEYFTTDSSVYMLSVSATECKLLKTAFNSREVLELMQLCTTASMREQQFQRYHLLAHQLYKQLFKPLQLSDSSIIISPDEYLLPFEVLQSDPADPMSFLVKRHAFSYTYAARSLMKIPPESAAGSHGFLGIAPVNYAPHLQLAALTGADLSLQNIRQYYHTPLCLSAATATRQQFLTHLPGSRIVQLYSHASAGNQDKEPVLYLADSALYLSELQLVQDSVTALIILSACEAGIGQHAKGEGVLSLARGFTLTGIPAIITTLWQIDNKATYELTEQFHRLLSQGLPKDIALQRAKLQFLADHDNSNQLPYFWAASILLGDTTPLQEPPHTKDNPISLFISAGILLLLFAYLLYRKLK